MALEIRNLSKFYGKIRALDDLTLTIPNGSFTCFLGPSGCGKTTLLRTIAGLETADSGTIHLDANDLSHRHPSERNFGVVFQSYSLFPNLTALKNVTYGLECRGWDQKRAKARAMEMLDMVHLADQFDKLPAQMSGGQQQRVAIARAIATEPSVLLLDEPLSALDAKVRTDLRQEVSKIQKDTGITTIMVTHDQAEALEMADQIVVLRNGTIEQTGSAHELYNSPKTEFVANFIGNSNTLHVTRGQGGVPVFGTQALTGLGPIERDTMFGLRPEMIALSAGPSMAAPSLASTVKAVRYLGNFNIVEVTPECAPDQTITVELHGPAAAPNVGVRVFATLNPDYMRELQQ
ncbi:MAG: ATP-binding cassette domain-containing protein [Pelagimonas sp.]|jgi:iron(III) transport system ATP-binding protein|nr:ATP-binding cassette domain-containing protein [Pelagimonas sp.]